MVNVKDVMIVMVFIFLVFTFVFSLVLTKHDIPIYKYDCEEMQYSLSNGKGLPMKCNWMFCDYYQPSEIFNYYSVGCQNVG
tara:strand:+ start:91 stop:333 length:243 start_codon:yes stop_codon:yes gene_type:complete